MRFSATAILALPLLAAAAQSDSPLDQAKAQAQYWLDKISSFIPNPNKQNPPVAAAVAKEGGKAINVLTLNDWEQTIRSSVKPASSGPEEWWVLVSGGNKTCFGRCTVIETAFNQSAIPFALDPTAPHLGYINCDDQPVLCNSWAAGAPSLWIIEVAAPPAPVNVRVLSLNVTSTTVKTLTDLHASQSWKTTSTHQGYFQPFDGQLAQFGLAVPIGYIFWAFGVVPSWIFMIGVSFLSRSIMSRRGFGPAAPGAPAGRPAAGPGAAAPAPRARVSAPPVV